MEQVEGYVESIVFYNEENGYTVFELHMENEPLTCVGNLPKLREGEYVEVSGSYVNHSVYGRQLKVSSCDYKDPTGVAAIELYLSSGAVKGIGKSLASSIVKKFGADALKIMETEPERLAEIKGISEKKAQAIATDMMERRSERKAIMFLQQYHIPLVTAMRFYKEYGEKIYEIIKTNPYKLAEDMRGIGFKTADEIAARAGIMRESEFRIRSGLIYVLQLASLNGHTCYPKEALTRDAAQMLSLPEEMIEDQYLNMVADKKIVMKDDMVYATVFYNMERSVAQMLDELNQKYAVSLEEMEGRIHVIEEETGITLDPKQIEAVENAITNGLFVLTGGPGTGKTTTINTMIRYFVTEGLEVFLAAPTGRAAKRMSELTHKEAKTIHRMLEFSGGNPESDDVSASGFTRNRQNPLEADVIIVDEASMIDITLMYSLLMAVPQDARLILVGDIYQLPSVGPGSVLKDMILSKAFPMVALTQIFRQAKESDIIVNAHKINEGEQVLLDNKSDDFFWVREYDGQKLMDTLLDLASSRIPKFVDEDPYDVQVLTPTKKGQFGVENLNKLLQAKLNPPAVDKREKEYGETVFREGDKVMQNRNNYQLEWEVRDKYGVAVDKGIGVFNGDVGTVLKINEFGKTMTVKFDEEREVEYEFKGLDELELAYALTVHKSQGSEYPAVILPLLGGPKMLLNRNLLYTAVTRARKCVVIAGDEKVFYTMAQNVTEQERYTGLCRRIEELLSKKQELV